MRLWANDPGIKNISNDGSRALCPLLQLILWCADCFLWRRQLGRFPFVSSHENGQEFGFIPPGVPLGEGIHIYIRKRER